jgi:hypothetical protein
MLGWKSLKVKPLFQKKTLVAQKGLIIGLVEAILIVLFTWLGFYFWTMQHNFVESHSIPAEVPVEDEEDLEAALKV